jgi:hypothetical protein
MMLIASPPFLLLYHPSFASGKRQKLHVHFEADDGAVGRHSSGFVGLRQTDSGIGVGKVLGEMLAIGSQEAKAAFASLP